MNSNKLLNCPNCGAPITSEQCPYCGSVFSFSAVKETADEMSERMHDLKMAYEMGVLTANELRNAMQIKKMYDAAISDMREYGKG